jgi:hypothetical protein
MNTSGNTKTSLSGFSRSAVSLLIVSVIAGLGVCANAQVQPQSEITTAGQHRDPSSPDAEIPPAVAKELQAVKARMAQMESQLNDLTAFVTPTSALTSRSTGSAPSEVTLIGTVSCGHCQGIQPTHKGYTQLTWALNSVSQGDDIVLLVQDKTYALQGDKDRLLTFMSAKARVTGRLEGNTLAVETIGRTAKGE